MKTLLAKPSTIEKAIRSLEDRMAAVGEGRLDPPRGYSPAEWLRESHKQLQILKQNRLQMPIG